jgi:hypothetical protein
MRQSVRHEHVCNANLSKCNTRSFVVTLFVVLALFSQTRVLETEEHRLSLEASSFDGKQLRTGSSTNPKSKKVSSHLSWCPKAVCHDSSLCQPCKRRFLIIIATGRSASTTLTYMMDSLPGVRMSGENNDTLGAIFRMIANIAQEKHFARQQENPKRAAWGHNPVPKGAFACVAQKMIETINPPLFNENQEPIEDDSDTIVGFKTIRFLRNKPERYDAELVKYVQEHFPCARILVNIRSDIHAQASSYRGRKGFRTEQRGVSSVERMNERMRRVATMFGNQAMLLDSSDWTKNIDSLNRVVQWLGFHESCNFKRLLEFNTGGENGFDHGETELVVDPNCRYVGETTDFSKALSS